MRWLFMDDKIWNRYKAELLSWIGTPYRHMCGVKGRGVDCSKFIGVSLINVGLLNGFDHEYYPPDWFLHIDKELILDYVERNRKFLKDGIDFVALTAEEKKMRGDYLGFAYNSPKGLVNHVGIMLDDGTFIHSAIGRGVCISQFTDFWQRHLKIILRVVEII
jgi:cell wall-associated NlpC family hydrolase